MTKSSREERLALAAYHEAGHAVVAYDQGIRVHGISVVPDGKRMGHARVDTLLLDRLALTFPSEKGARNRFAMERHVMVLLAGYAAVKRLRPDSSGEEHRHTQGSDVRSALTLLEAFAEDEGEAEKYYEWLRARTAGIIGSPMRWYQVERLAAALLEHGALGPRKVREIIRKAGEDWRSAHGPGGRTS